MRKIKKEYLAKNGKIYSGHLYRDGNKYVDLIPTTGYLNGTLSKKEEDVRFKVVPSEGVPIKPKEFPIQITRIIWVDGMVLPRIKEFKIPETELVYLDGIPVVFESNGGWWYEVYLEQFAEVIEQRKLLYAVTDHEKAEELKKERWKPFADDFRLHTFSALTRQEQKLLLRYARNRKAEAEVEQILERQPHFREWNCIYRFTRKTVKDLIPLEVQAKKLYFEDYLE